MKNMKEKVEDSKGLIHDKFEFQNERKEKMRQQQVLRANDRNAPERVNYPLYTFERLYEPQAREIKTKSNLE